MGSPGGFLTFGATLYSKNGMKFSARDVEEISCPFCKLVLRKPMQLTSCGHRFCRTCLEVESISECPIDGEAIVPQELFNDKACQSEIESLESSCIMGMNGCRWRGPLLKLEDHMKTCTLASVICGRTFPTLEMDAHNNSRECPNYAAVCANPGCDSLVSSSHEHSLQKRTAPSLRPTMPSSLTNTDGGADCQEKSVPLGAGPQSVHADRGYGSLPVPSPSSINTLSVDDSRRKNSTQHGNTRPTEERREVRQQHLAVVGSLDDIKLKQDILDVKTTSGVFIWKIPDIRKCLRDAVERRTLSLYSPPFYSSPHSYRMCIRVYLNGDGSGSGTHLSMFFVLMHSEHDGSLRWPFTQPVTFTLVNQRFATKNVSKTFFPASQRDQLPFQRPQSEMNEPSGLYRFVPQSVWRDVTFTQDGTLSILCEVGMSKLLI